MAKKEEKRKNWFRKLRDKYRLVIINEDTLEDKYSVRLSRLNVFVVIGMSVLVLSVLTFYLIAYTPLKEYIPGYENIALNKKIIGLEKKIDSLEYYKQSHEKYISDIKKIISGETIVDTVNIQKDNNENPAKYDTISYRITGADSALRAEYERETSYKLLYNQDEELMYSNGSLNRLLFFPPVKGMVVNSYNKLENHFACDIVANAEEPVKAVYDGVVIFSGWTLLTGYVIIVQHPFNYISVYKHNNAVLKKQGERVKAGDPIAIIGNSGELSTGPHLHFELWHNGIPLNPEEYINF